MRFPQTSWHFPSFREFADTNKQCYWLQLLPLFHFVRPFLLTRTRLVRVLDEIFSPYEIQNGVPQREVCRVLLFLIEMRRGSSLNVFFQTIIIKRYSQSTQAFSNNTKYHLQLDILAEIPILTLQNLPNHLQKMEPGSHSPLLLLQGFQIKTSHLIKFPGLPLHRASNWIHPITNLKAKFPRSDQYPKILIAPI